MNRLKTISVLLFFALIAASSFQVSSQQSKIFYVPDSFPTIQAAVDAAAPGTAIIVRDGAYRENIAIEDKSDIVIKSEHGAENAIILNNENVSDAVVIKIISSRNITLQGFTIANDKDFVAHGVEIISSSHVNATGNIVKGPNINTAFILYSSDGTVLKNNTIRETFNGIQVDSSNDCMISNNLIIGMSGYGIHFRQNNNGNIVEKNTISSIQSTVPEIVAAGIIIDSNWGGEIKLNSIAGCQAGIIVSSPMNSIYLNQFINNGKHVVVQMANTTWNSGPLDYIYDGRRFNSPLGNYWDDYRGADQNHDGVGDSFYMISEGQADRYPLMELINSYTILPPPQTSTASPTATSTAPSTTTSTKLTTTYTPPTTTTPTKTTTTPSTTTTSQASTSTSPGSQGLPIGVLIIGAVLLLVAVSVVALYAQRRKEH